MDSGNDSAFEAFVRRYSSALFLTARMLTGTDNSAEELLQDTLVALYPHWDRVVGAQSAEAYVRRAMTNRFVTSLRRGARSTTVADLPDVPVGPGALQAVLDRDMVVRLLSQLPPRQRAAVVLRYLHDLSDEQIGQSLRCRPGTVRSLISRAVAVLRELSSDPISLEAPDDRRRA